MLSFSFHLGFGQKSYNIIINDTNAHSDILYGYCNYQGLKSSIPFKIFWDIESAYEIKTPSLDSIKTNWDEITITIVFGSWCDDSRMNVPRFIKILQFLDFPEERVNIIAVNKKKKADPIQTEELNIQKVPTFIIYRNGVEIGRIIENPIITLESDLKSILMK